MVQESTQEGEVKEQPKEEISKDVSEPASTEKKATSRIEDTEEYRNIQSQKDKADARAIKAEKSVESMQNQLQELRNDMERERLEAQKRQLDALADDPDAQKKLMAKFDLDKERRDFEAHQKREREGMLRAWNQASDLVREYNLNPADAADLLNAESPKEMELMAKLKAAEQIKVETPTKEESFVPDSNKSDSGGSDDKQFMKDYAAGKSSDHARMQKILANMRDEKLV